MTVSKRKVFVLEVDAPRHCLRGVRNPKIRALPEGHDGPPIQEITLLPVSQDDEVLARANEIPNVAWVPAREGRGKVVFDASQEGRAHDPVRTGVFHDFLGRHGVPLSQAVYITQDRGYEADYRRHCQDLGLDKGMRIVVFDYWPRALARQNEVDAAEEFEARLHAYRARPRTRPRRFLSLNRMLRRTKALFLLRLLEEGLWDRGAISLGGVDWQMEQTAADAAQMHSKLFDQREFDDLNHRLEPLLPRLREKGRIQFETDKAHPKFGHVLDEPLAEYGQTWFSVVTESEMGDRLSRITEKSVKPLRNFHPMIVLGNPGSLTLLRSYGFETFGDLFDEAYDEEPDPRRRFEMVFQEVRRLCAMEEPELERLELGLDEILVFNAKQALVVLPQVFRHQLDVALVAAILGEPGGPTAGLPQFHLAESLA